MKRLIAPEVKSPCPKLWQDMKGDAKTRFCDHCQLHVQNLSAMSSRNVARVLERSQTERVCVTYTCLSDGSLVTRWNSFWMSLISPFRRGLAWALAGCLPLVISACQTQRQVAGYVTAACKPPPPKKTTSAEVERIVVTGGI